MGRTDQAPSGTALTVIWVVGVVVAVLTRDVILASLRALPASQSGSAAALWTGDGPARTRPSVTEAPTKLEQSTVRSHHW